MSLSKPIALAGIGKIARDQHIPAIEGSPDWSLEATISRNAGVDGVRGFADMAAFLADPGDIATVSLALPPGPRLDYAVQAIEAGLNVMLEKPPGRTIAECRWLAHLARDRDVTLYATWHSRMGAAVPVLVERLKSARLRKLAITWHEDVRQWHPGQDWVWEAGNLGVFDPGINAMSILVALLDKPVYVASGHFHVPANAGTPITADMRFDHPDGADITCHLDWGHNGDPVWDFVIETDQATYEMGGSGSSLKVDGAAVDVGPTAEYPALYDRMADLVRSGSSEVDLRPMELVADAFLMASREPTAFFEW